MGTNNPGPLQPMTSQEAEGNQPKPDTRVGVEAGVGFLPRIQTCMVPRLCCRHGGRGREEVVGPGGWLGARSCQLCTNSATSSVSFPVGENQHDHRRGVRGEADGAQETPRGRQGVVEPSLELPSQPAFPYGAVLLKNPCGKNSQECSRPCEFPGVDPCCSKLWKATPCNRKRMNV